jgi:malate dehydrogenase
MYTVAIIGAGELGGACAHALAARDVASRIVLVDANASLAAGKALDIQQCAPVQRFHTRLSGTDDVSVVAGCTACIVADRAPHAEWTGEDGLALLARLLSYAPAAPVVMAGPSAIGVMTTACRELGVRRERLVGSAPEAMASAVRAIVALEARCAPGDVMLTVLGTPREIVVPWSEASIAGFALDRRLSQAQIARVEARVARLWPPGPYALGAAAAEMAAGLLCSARRSFSAFALLDGEFGVRGAAGAVPIAVSARGIERVAVPTLNTRERVRVEISLGG